jgi:serine/threonine-protein kinase HipA
MGALRFKRDKEGEFLNNDPYMPTPPLTSIRELQHAAEVIESDSDPEEARKWLAILIAPGSSLGGARPKANVIDNDGQLWIAKFPSVNDTIDKGAWEYLAHRLAQKCGIQMAPCRIEKIAGKHHTFFTQRFDRQQSERIHFASAMTMTGYDETALRDSPASYLDIAEFIQFHGTQNTSDLHQLWRRIVFHIAISNTDDHLRNHGFLLTDKGWILSPAYDLNPSIDKGGLALNIDADLNALDFDLACSAGEYFQLSIKQMNSIVDQVKTTVKYWRTDAKEIGISRSEQEMMAGAFRW